MRFLRLILPGKRSNSFTLDEAVVEDACHRFGIHPGSLTPIRHSTAHVYDNSGISFLKIIPERYQSHASLSQICLWQDFLHGKLEEIVPLVASSNGLFAEKIKHNTGLYSAVLYEKAKGSPIRSPDWQQDMFLKIGKLTGSMHRVSKEYTKTHPANHIPEWNSVAVKIMQEQLLPSDKRISDRLSAILNRIKKYAVSENSYGIIHSDIHRGNLMQSQRGLTLFDFEDTCFSWFANDIANIFYHALMYTDMLPDESLRHMEAFQNYFWKGYNEENALDKEHMETIPVWVAFRALFTYGYLLKIGEQDNFDPSHQKYFLHCRKFAHEEFEQVESRLFY